MLVYFFKSANREQLENFTVICTEDAIRDVELIKGRIEIEKSFESSKEEFFEKFVQNLRDIYGNKGLGWIERAEYDIEDDEDDKENKLLYLRIVHGINRNFSRFFIKMLSNVMDAIYKLNINSRRPPVVEVSKIEFLLDIKLEITNNPTQN
jgi:hypothetical protein